MLFKREFHARILDGTITLTFRAWSKPQAKAGGRQRFGTYDGSREASGFLEIDAVDLVSLASVTDSDARRAGFADRTALLAQLRATSRTLRSNAKVYRVSFRYRPIADERARLAADAALSAEDIDALAARLESMDARGAHGPWTRETLALIAGKPGVAASLLSKELRRETKPFKTDVRKLKALGLTISLETGYRLSPRGEAFLRQLK